MHLQGTVDTSLQVIQEEAEALVNSTASCKGDFRPWVHFFIQENSDYLMCEVLVLILICALE